MTTHFHLVGRLPKRFADGNENDDFHPTTTWLLELFFDLKGYPVKNPTLACITFLSNNPVI